ncbi:MAG: Crp/Fnr family transcriptional regulator [Cytophagales bacterium]|jgi:CRP-like cAMP-binding protein|nr:Crp/Fnr family transcriptional regulator [Cytophagales bacterium]MCA6413192.1 Crp/Fnr family transcriptional regulator [Cytophagales bacterium]MCA6424628.1 Crp/Fnr family transcriptional regulator [Cytophagales bacterium]MCA6429266.1 Crp/Fnr family transcriptional regulator [Cytophagales bacterium]MCA6433746.1 Crp/Fnr family transcriptional regulator [Cytophagales bacterium]
MVTIRLYFNKFVKLNDSEWADFEKCIVKVNIAKNVQILKQGEHCNFIAFIQEGSFRLFYDKDGEVKITAFFFQGDFVSNYRSFLTGKPSDHCIEAMQDAVIYSINLDELKTLYDKHKSIERLGRLIAENLYLSVANRLDSFLFQTPSERYQALIERNSRLLQEIPQYMIASYLGVKPETLSRIRTRK